MAGPLTDMDLEDAVARAEVDAHILEVPPVNQVISTSPRKGSKFAAGSGQVAARTAAADTREAGVAAPFRGRSARSAYPTSPLVTAASQHSADRKRRSFLARKYSEKVADATEGPAPSAPPRKSSKMKSDARLPMERADKSVNATKARKARLAREAAEREAAEQRAFDKEQEEQKKQTPTQRKLRAAFRFIDTDDSGVLSNEELEQLLQLVFPSYGWEKLLEMHEAIMKECDADNSNTISLDEFVNSTYAQELAAPAEKDEARRHQRAKLEKSFKAIDTDGSGSIDYKELEILIKNVFPSMGKVGQREYFESIRAECDANGDGRIGMDEFLDSKYANMLSRPSELADAKQERQNKLKASFAQVDRDKSGQIDHEELMDLMTNVFADYDDKTLSSFHAVIVAECDGDNSGTISIDEFLSSQYANLLAGVDETSAASSAIRPDGAGGMSLFARTDRIKQRRVIKNTRDLRMSKMGTVEEGDTPPSSPTRGQQALDEMTGRADTPETEKKQYGFLPEHLRSTEDEAADEERAKYAAAQELLAGVQGGTAGYGQGVMEKERRFAAVTNLFHKWDEVLDISVAGSGFIEYSELRRVLQRFFNWTDHEASDNADALISGMDVNADGRLEWTEFVEFITQLTGDSLPSQFDNLLKYLYEAIGEVSEDAEFERRDRLLAKLFAFWDYDESGYVEKRELSRVMTRYNGMDKNQSEHFMELAMGAVDDNDDGLLDHTEFCNFFQGLTYLFTPDDFDFMVYRLRRAIEHVQMLAEGTKANVKFRAVLENHLASNELQQLVQQSKPTNPIILFGTSYDPARAVERCAAFNGCQLEPCMVTHSKGEQQALMELRKKGFQRGWWIYLVLGEDYNPDRFMREVGVALQTDNWSIMKKFRLWILAPYMKITHFPNVILMDALTINLDAVKPPAGKTVVASRGPVDFS